MRKNCFSRFRFPLISLVVTLFAASLYAESSLQVKCEDASGNPVPGVKVFASPMSAQKAKDKKADDKGVAEFSKLDDGAYRVVGRKDGFAPALHEFVVLKGARESVTLKMTAGAEKKLYFEDPEEQKRAQGLFDQGLAAYKAGKVAEGEKLLSEAAAANPSNAEALYYLAVTRLLQAKFDETAAAMDRADVIANVLGNEAVKKGVQDLRNKLIPTKAKYLIDKKEYAQAAAVYSEAIKANPNDPDAYANLAVALTYDNKFDEALATLDKALQLKPGASTLVDLQKRVLARKDTAKLEKAKVLLSEGNRLLEKGEGAEALKKFEETMTLVPENQQHIIWRQIARARGKLNQAEPAIEAFKKSVELAPADKKGEFVNSFAQYHIDTKNYEAAMDLLAAPQSAGNPEEALLALVNNVKNKAPQLAQVALERVVKLNAANVDACFELGQLYYMDGKDKDKRTKELLSKYIEAGKDSKKLDDAKNMLVIINRRTK